MGNLKYAKSILKYATPVLTVVSLRGTASPSTNKVYPLTGIGNFNFSSGKPAGTYVDNGSTVIVPTGGNGSAAFIREDTVVTFMSFDNKRITVKAASVEVL